MTASFMHLIILNSLVVNSPRAMEQRIIPELDRGSLYVFMVIFKSRRTEWDTVRMGYGEIECNSNKDRERLLLTVKASPFISLIQNESNLPK